MLTGIAVTVCLSPAILPGWPSSQAASLQCPVHIVGLEHAVPGLTPVGVFPDAYQPQQRLVTLHEIPTVLSVSPNHGPIVGGTFVTVLGAHFESAASVRFGAAAAEAIVVSSPSTLTCLTPAHAPGLVSVFLSNDGVRESELVDAFTFEPPLFAGGPGSLPTPGVSAPSRALGSARASSASVMPPPSRGRPARGAGGAPGLSRPGRGAGQPSIVVEFYIDGDKVS